MYLTTEQIVEKSIGNLKENSGFRLYDSNYLEGPDGRYFCGTIQKDIPRLGEIIRKMRSSEYSKNHDVRATGTFKPMEIDLSFFNYSNRDGISIYNQPNESNPEKIDLRFCVEPYKLAPKISKKATPVFREFVEKMGDESHITRDDFFKDFEKKVWEIDIEYMDKIYDDIPDTVYIISFDRFIKFNDMNVVSSIDIKMIENLKMDEERVNFLIDLINS